MRTEIPQTLVADIGYRVGGRRRLKVITVGNIVQRIEVVPYIPINTIHLQQQRITGI